MVVSKDEFQEEPSLVVSEQQHSPELRRMESSGHNREGKNNNVLCLEAEGAASDEGVRDWSLFLFCLSYFYQEKSSTSWEGLEFKGKNLKPKDEVTVKGEAHVRSLSPYSKMTLGTWVSALLDL